MNTTEKLQQTQAAWDQTLHELLECPPFSVSNDVWRDKAVTRALGQQQRGAEHTAALIVGTGGLPYTLGMLATTYIVQSDLHQEVLTNTTKRLEAFEEADDWDSYIATLQESVDRSVKDPHRCATLDAAIFEEFKAYRHWGIATDEAFSLIKRRAQAVRLVPVLGNILVNEGQIQTLLTKEHRQLSIAHMSNAAGFIRKGHQLGYEPLAQLLSRLDRTDDFRVLYSRKTERDLLMRITTLEGYKYSISGGKYPTLHEGTYKEAFTRGVSPLDLADHYQEQLIRARAELGIVE